MPFYLLTQIFHHRFALNTNLILTVGTKHPHGEYRLIFSYFGNFGGCSYFIVDKHRLFEADALAETNTTFAGQMVTDEGGEKTAVSIPGKMRFPKIDTFA